ncbi:MAG: hypothetical protein ACM3YM_13525, partial [Sphingomonadales bacterium]
EEEGRNLSFPLAGSRPGGFRCGGYRGTRKDGAQLPAAEEAPRCPSRHDVIYDIFVTVKESRIYRESRPGIPQRYAPAAPNGF